MKTALFIRDNVICITNNEKQIIESIGLSKKVFKKYTKTRITVNETIQLLLQSERGAVVKQQFVNVKQTCTNAQ